MSIYVNRITKVNDPLPSPPIPNCINLNCLSWFPNNVYDNIPLYQLSPYYLKDSQNHIFENIWQGSKVYASVDEQYQVKGGNVIWSHRSEIHVQDNTLTKEFWSWRRKLWNNPYPVRYPNGYYGRSKCLYALWFEDNKWIQLDYIAARKKIYCNVYSQLVNETEAFKILKQRFDSGENIQICEMDVRPSIITKDILLSELNNTTYPFGHGYVLAACLMNISL